MCKQLCKLLCKILFKIFYLLTFEFQFGELLDLLLLAELTHCFSTLSHPNSQS